MIEHDATCTASGHPENWTMRANFHVGDECHGENDPNGLVYYNGVYHFFFQDHVTGGTVGGHMASRDFVNWKRLPVAIWNDEWYDKGAVWTFSATIVDDVPVMVYPGIAQPNDTLGDCGSMCFTHAIALPADTSDPWLVDWVKPDYNPIRMGTQRDPSTAWRTAAGEWRYTNVKKEIFSSWDFKHWEMVGILDEFGGGECPDVFEIPPLCEGCSADNGAGIFKPTHVHANVGYQLGIYDDGKANSTGTWTIIPDWNPKYTKMDGEDSALFYASKSFWDPVKERRIVWGWVKTAAYLEDAPGFRGGQCPGVGQVMTNTNSLPRVATYDPALQSLLFFPVEEMENLRGKKLANVGEQDVSGSVPLNLKTGIRQSEMKVSFAMPTEATRLGVSVMTGTDADGNVFGTEVFIDFVPNNNNDDFWYVQAGHDSSSMLCPNKTKSGLGTPSHIACPVHQLPLPLKRSDSTLDISIWVDNLVVEAYFMGGRNPWTIALPCAALADGERGAAVFADGAGAKLQSVQAWAVASLTYETVEQSNSELLV
jgi:beta-fructofuranosidase